MCDGPSENTAKDVRAEVPHRVAVTLTIGAVDAEEAAERVLNQLPDHVTVRYIQASVEEEAW